MCTETKEAVHTLGLDVAANLSGLIVCRNIGFCQFHISWLSKSLEERDDAAAVHFFLPTHSACFCACLHSGYLISIDVLMSLASQIPFKQGDVQHNATRLFSFDSSTLSTKQRWHISHRGIVAFSPWLLLAFLFNMFLWKRTLGRQSWCWPFSLKDHPQLSTNKRRTVLELEHRELQRNPPPKSKHWSWAACKVELNCLCFHLFLHIQRGTWTEGPAK